MITLPIYKSVVRNAIISIAITLIIILPHISLAQISAGGIPPGFGKPADDYSIVTLQIPSPETDQLLKEDEEAGRWGVAERVGVLLPVRIGLSDHGSWNWLNDGSLQWRLRIGSENAKHIALYFENFYLPRGCELFIYNDLRSDLIGAFTYSNNHESGLFATEMISGESLIIELIVLPQAKEQARFTITDLLYAYRNEGGDLKQFGNSGDCNVNVNCSEGFNWQDEKRAVVKIYSRVGQSVFRCSGSLINNTRHDYLPYVLTADHCARTGSTYASADDFKQWLFYFNYEAEGCPNPEIEPSSVSLTGATLKANVGGGNANMGSDFCLLLLNDEIPPSVMPFYNGWSRIDVSSPTGVGIHHPSGDIKKISTYTTPLISTSWDNNTPNMYWKVRWSETQNGHGVTEGGSSGSPLFNDKGLIVGQLTGGQASCNNLTAPDYYGKFSVSWESIGESPNRQLKHWLDPDNTGVEELKGSYDVTQVVSIFMADTTAIEAGGRIGFKDFSINEPTEWHWVFQGGEPAVSFERDPGQITYSSFGKHSVTLIVKNDLSSDTLVRSNYIKVVPGIFPNPARNQVSMLLGNHDKENLRIELTDITGRLVADWQYDIRNLYSVNINTTGLRGGVYILSVFNDGQVLSRQKLILER